jgi:hypothetical protein
MDSAFSADSDFGLLVFSSLSWCSSYPGAESFEPSASFCCTSTVIGFSPRNTGGRQLRRCSWNFKTSSLSSGARACIRAKTYIRSCALENVIRE